MSVHPEAEQLSAFIDGALDAGERTALEAHVAGCADCRATLAAIRATLADLSALDTPEPSEHDRRAIRAAVAHKTTASRSRRWVWAGGAVAAAVIGLLGYVVSTHTQGGAGKSEDTAAAGLARSGVLDLTTEDANALVHSLAAGGTLDQYQRAEAAGSGGSAPAPQAAPGYAAASPTAAQIEVPERSLRSCVTALQDSKHRSAPIQTDLALFNHEPVYLVFFEFPAKNPERVELWIVARATCEVRYFTQAKTHS